MDLVEAMEKSAPGKTVEIGIQRGGAAEKLTAHLTRQPLGIIRPEADSKPVELVAPGNHDPLSFLMTIQQFDDRTLGDDNQELGGVNLRDAEWEVAAADQDSVSYRTVVPRLGLQIVKTYRVAKVPQEQLANAEYPAYNITLDVSITNVGDRSHEVAYRLDGPTGLPIEGAWYANKVSRTWSGAGLRDIAPRFEGGQVEQITPAQLVDPDFKDHWANSSLDYIAVDAQYFAAALIPFDGEAAAPARFADVRPVRVGEVPKEKTNTRLVNVSFRLDSEPVELAPGAAPLVHHFMIFTGPKRPALLAQYGPANATLKELLYYGSFAVRSVAVPLLEILHFFHGIVGNYGLAIIMLTVVVRGSMFPLSRKQALSAQKMAELQPEMKRINEKYKSEPDKRTKAQQDLFRQHKYNPMGGCLLGICPIAGVRRLVSLAIGRRRTAPGGVVRRQCPLGIEPGGPRHALELVGVHARFRDARNGDARLGAFPEYLPADDDWPLHLAAESDDAPAGRRTGGHAAEDDEVHDGLHGRLVLQSRQRIVPVLHRLEPVGDIGAQVHTESGCQRPRGFHGRSDRLDGQCRQRQWRRQ